MRQLPLNQPHPPSHLARYVLFWAISIFDLGMILLTFLVPNYVALWAFIGVAASCIAGITYKAQKPH
jgi:hypothetical protein